MFMNESAHKENTKDSESAYVSSPLRHDYEGRFSRKGQIAKKRFANLGVWDNLLVFLFIAFLISCDFILFTGSGNVEIFGNEYLPMPEIMLTLGVIFVVSAIVVFLFYKHPRVRHILASFAVLLFVYMLYQQFALYLPDFNFGTYIVPKYIILGIVFAAITFAVFEQDKFIYRVLYVIAVIVLFFNILFSYKSATETHEFLETYNTQKIAETPNKRFIYFMFPNLVSYSYLSTFNNEEATKTQSIMQGFLQKNNFRTYTKAFTPENSYLDNMIMSMNPTSDKESHQHLNQTRLLSEYWRFHNLRNEYIYLKDNELYDVFKRNKYQISAYKSRDFDMCHKKHKFNVNRCIEKVNHPINIYSVNLTVPQKTGVLIIEWLSSLKISDKISSVVYKFLDPIVNVDNIPMIGTNYKNLYVVNSAKTFDVLFENIKQDNGKQAYFAFVDLPSDMYIYDEYCQITPQKDWLNISNLPWIKRDYTPKRQTAYLQQTRCLFGKLEQFIDNMQKEDLWKDTIMVIQGISGVNNFQNLPIKDTVQEFLANRTVSMAIYDGNMSEPEVDSRLCSTNQIISEYLFGKKTCTNSVSGIHQKIVDTLGNSLDKLTNNIQDDNIGNFDKWYAHWLIMNHQQQTIPTDDELVKYENNYEEESKSDQLENRDENDLATIKDDNVSENSDILLPNVEITDKTAETESEVIQQQNTGTKETLSSDFDDLGIDDLFDE